MTVNELIHYLKGIQGNLEVLHRMSDGSYREIRPEIVKVWQDKDGRVLKVFNPTYDFQDEHGVIEVIEL